MQQQLRQSMQPMHSWGRFHAGQPVGPHPHFRPPGNWSVPPPGPPSAFPFPPIGHNFH
jgi:hypothetical protein